MLPPTPSNEERRISALREVGILDTPPEKEFDDITFLAAQICETPIATISLVDSSRQWFKSVIGMDIRETPREQAFCAHAICDPDATLIVSDAAADERFSGSPLVTGPPSIRFYAGTPLVTRDNCAIGVLCVADTRPRVLSQEQVQALEALGRQLTLRLELRRTTRLLEAANRELEQLSMKDELTGLYNFRGLMLHGDQLMRRFHSGRFHEELWILLGDMDGLKDINDTFGHAEGSEAIRTCSEIITETLRATDIVARLGGDEFAAIIIDASDEIVQTIPSRLEEAFVLHNESSGLPYSVQASFGIVKAERSADESIADLLKRADEEMYRNKRFRKRLAA